MTNQETNTVISHIQYMENSKSCDITPQATEKDFCTEISVRPKTLEEFIGNSSIKYNLSVFIQAAKKRKEQLDHVILHGPPGLGKTTLSQIIANELNSNIKFTTGPMLAKPGDLAAILTNLKETDVLFIDEIHRINPLVAEFLYSAMEQFVIDIIIGEGPSARTVRIDIAPFTLIGATTRLGLLSTPFKDRFGISIKLDFYSSEELAEIVKRCAAVMNISIDPKAALKLGQLARGTPRIAIRILRRARDFAEIQEHIKYRTLNIDENLIKDTLSRLGIDEMGLDKLDYKYIDYILKHYDGGPVGIENIAAGLGEEKDTIEETVEPYMLQIGFVHRTPRGRVLTKSCIQYIEQKRYNN